MKGHFRSSFDFSRNILTRKQPFEQLREKMKIEHFIPESFQVTQFYNVWIGFIYTFKPHKINKLCGFRLKGP